MERQVTVYARRADPISIGDIQERMRQRALPVEWKPSPLTGALGTTEWISGTFISEEHPNAQVVAGRETLSQGERREALEDQRKALAPQHRDAVLAAESSYSFATDGTDDTFAERMLVHLADIVAELGNGVIVDTVDQASYDHAAFRARHARALGAG
jgi:hypothetical protein